MAPRPDTVTGTITLTAGQVAFTTVGTNMLTRQHLPGDTIRRAGFSLIIDEITGENTGTLVEPCPADAAGIDVPVRIRFQADGSRIAAQTRNLLDLLDSNAFFQYDASGPLSERALYDTAPKGFSFLRIDTNPAQLYIKASNSTGDWSGGISYGVGPKGDQGFKGWSPIHVIVPNGDDLQVLKLVDYVGGAGAKPTEGVGWFLSENGYTPDINLATNVRGAQGLTAYQVAVLNGYVGTQAQWLASLVGRSAYQIAVINGYVGTEQQWLLTLYGADGTDPGVLMYWDDATSDNSPAAGHVRANNADLSLATFLYVAKLNRSGNDLAAWLASMDDSSSILKGDIALTNPSNEDQALFTLTGVTDAASYVKLAVIYRGGVSDFSPDVSISLQFYRSGDPGSGDVSTVNNITPTGGNVALTSADIPHGGKTIEVAINSIPDPVAMAIIFGA